MHLALPRRPQRSWLWLALLVALIAGDSRAATLEQDIVSSLEQLRAVRADQNSQMVEQYNRQMDAAWRLFIANKTEALPILRTQLRAELARASPSDLLLLDIGFFLYANDGPEGKGVAREALSRADLQAPIVKLNDRELFEFLHLLAEDRDALVLSLIEKTFLTWDSQVVLPQHALRLDGSLICVFLYGAYGSEAEESLRPKLADKATARRVLEILSWLGSPAALPEVRQAMMGSPDYDTFTRITSYMMQAAGPGGRSAMLEIDPQRLDARSREYFSGVRKAIEDTSFAFNKARFANLPGDEKLSDAEVSSRLDAMIENYGKDDRTNPVAILNSELSADVLIAKLTDVRRRTLFRLSNEALFDVQVTNVLINTLRYREK